MLVRSAGSGPPRARSQPAITTMPSSDADKQAARHDAKQFTASEARQQDEKMGYSHDCPQSLRTQLAAPGAKSYDYVRNSMSLVTLARAGRLDPFSKP